MEDTPWAGGIIRVSMALAAGTKLDGYEILSLLGEGGMGEVYRARDPVLKRDVAIKVLPQFVSQDPERMRRFQQEAQAAAALNHPNILAVYQLGNFEGTTYLVSELLEGGTVRGERTQEALDHRRDIFGFGGIFYELVTRQRAFKKPTSAETMTAILHEDPPAIFPTTAGLSPGLLRIVQRCLEKQPERRFQSASDLAFALEALSDFTRSTATGVAQTAVEHAAVGRAAESPGTWKWVAAAVVFAAL